MDVGGWFSRAFETAGCGGVRSRATETDPAVCGGQGRKRDATDAELLVRALRRGEVPDARDEAAQDLVRAREHACGDLMRARHRLSKLVVALRAGVRRQGVDGCA